MVGLPAGPPAHNTSIDNCRLSFTISRRGQRLGGAQLALDVLVGPGREEEAVALPLPRGRRLHRLELRPARAVIAERLRARHAPQQHSRDGRRYSFATIRPRGVVGAHDAAAVAHVLRAHPPTPRGLRQRRAPEGRHPRAQPALQPLSRDIRAHKRGGYVHAPLGLTFAVEAPAFVPLVLGQVVLLRRERSLGGGGVCPGLAPRRGHRPRALVLLQVVLSLHGVNLPGTEPAVCGCERFERRRRIDPGRVGRREARVRRHRGDPRVDLRRRRQGHVRVHARQGFVRDRFRGLGHRSQGCVGNEGGDPQGGPPRAPRRVVHRSHKRLVRFRGG